MIYEIRVEMTTHEGSTFFERVARFKHKNHAEKFLASAAWIEGIRPTYPRFVRELIVDTTFDPPR